MKVEAGPRNAPCTVYKYKPELTPGSINQGRQVAGYKVPRSPAKRRSIQVWLHAKERKKGLDGQKNGSPAQSGDKSNSIPRTARFLLCSQPF